MDRRTFLMNSALVSAGAMLPLNLFAKYRRDFVFKEIRRNVGYFSERGGTIGWLVNDDALVAVDSQFPDSASNFIAQVKEKNSRPMDLLINSHHHGDHTGGNPAFKGYAQHIVAHENVPGYQLAAAERQGQEAVDAHVTADVTYSKTWSQEVGDETVHLSYYGPAHTGGDSVIYFEKANVAHMGDLVFNRAYPFIDPSAGASIRSWVSVLQSTIEVLPADTVYIFGHGNPNFGITGSADDLKVKADYLQEVLNFTGKAVRAGSSREEIMATEILPGFEDFAAPGWRMTLGANLGTAYDEITAN